MTSTMLYRYSMIIAAALLLGACADGDDDISDISLIDPEVNEMRITFTDPEVAAASETFVHDASGDSTSTDDIVLGQGVLSVSADFRDIRDASNIIDMTERINDNAEGYQVFYEFQNGADTVVTGIVFNDLDSDNRRVGLSTTWEITAPTGGGESVRIYLVSGHDKQGVALNNHEYDQSQHGGEIEIDAVFSLNVE